MLELCARAPLIVVAFFVTVRTRHQFLHLPRKIYGILLLPFLPMHECITTSETGGAEKEREGETDKRPFVQICRIIRAADAALLLPSVCFLLPTLPPDSKGRDDDVSTLHYSLH